MNRVFGRDLILSVMCYAIQSRVAGRETQNLLVESLLPTDTYLERILLDTSPLHNEWFELNCRILT